jgi:transposase InsO family protein
VNRLEALLLDKTKPSATAAPQRRGLAAQRPRRLLENQVRESIVDFSLWTAQQGWTLRENAHLLQLTPRTLRQWQYDCRPSLPLSIVPLGRPLLRSGVHERNAVLDLLNDLGPATGVPTLRTCFPDMPRAELENLLQRFRRVWRLRYQQAQRVLNWTTPGSVWAMDFAEAPQPIDGRYRYLFAVRDLASGQQLLWLPLAEATAQATVHALTSLFALYGAPLVLKSDNGSTFDAALTLALLEQFAVTALFSPPYWPRYNGSIEAGIGSLKTRTEYRAAVQGHPGYWTSDDVSAAQAEANAASRPKGPTGPTAQELWQTRKPMSSPTRTLFLATLACQRRDRPASSAGLQTSSMTATDSRTEERQAVQRALVEHGFLLFTRRRIPLPFRRTKVT